MEERITDGGRRTRGNQEDKGDGSLSARTGERKQADKAVKG